MTPEISVIMPTHNRADLLPRAVASVLAQTYPDFELIIVDDASTDKTRAYLDGLTDHRIIVITRDINGGNAAARNTGLNACRGRYIAFLDSDDEYTPAFLERVAAALDLHSEASFALTGREIIDADGSVREERELGISPGPSAYHGFLRRFPGGTNRGLTIRRECLEAVGIFDEALRAAVDTDYVLRLVRSGRYCYVAEALVRYHKHGHGQVTDNSLELAQAYRRIVAKNRSAIQADSDLFVRFMNKTARLFYEAGEGRRARVFLASSIRRRPTSLSSWGMLVAFELFGQAGRDVYRRASIMRGATA
jgi:glycosyltransferase involved in cell wall biosynthesis